MAISINNTASGQEGFGNDFSFTFTVASDDDYIVVMVGTEEGGGSGTVVIDPGGADEATFNLDADGQFTAGGGADSTVAFHYLLATNIPAAGDYTIQVTFSSASKFVAAGAIGLSGAAQQAPEAYNSATQSGTNWSLDVSGTTDGALVIDTGCTPVGETESPGAGQTQWLAEEGGGDVFGSHESSAGGTVTMSWSFSSGADEAHLAGSVAPSSGGGGGLSIPVAQHHYRQLRP